MDSWEEYMKKYCPQSFRVFVDEYFHLIECISNFLSRENKAYELGKYRNKVTPPMEKMMAAFSLVSFDPDGLMPNSIKAVFVFMDAYPRKGAACGVPVVTLDGQIQPTLANLYKRLKETYKIPTYSASYDDLDHKDKWEDSVLAFERGILPEELPDGDIRGLSSEGVFFLNCALTTRENEIKVHIDEWSLITEPLIKWLSRTFPFLVFVFFGKEAQNYSSHVSASKHKIICTSHPSNAGYNAGFGNSNIQRSE